MDDDTDEDQTIVKKIWNGGQTDAAGDHTPLVLRIPRYPGPSLNETYCGRWLAACRRAHPPVCRCCNPCPKSRGPTEQSARPRIRASHFPFPSRSVGHREDRPRLGEVRFVEVASGVFIQ